MPACIPTSFNGWTELESKTRGKTNKKFQHTNQSIPTAQQLHASALQPTGRFAACLADAMPLSVAASLFVSIHGLDVISHNPPTIEGRVMIGSREVPISVRCPPGRGRRVKVGVHVVLRDAITDDALSQNLTVYDD